MGKLSCPTTYKDNCLQYQMLMPGILTWYLKPQTCQLILSTHTCNCNLTHATIIYWPFWISSSGTPQLDWFFQLSSSVLLCNLEKVYLWGIPYSQVQYLWIRRTSLVQYLWIRCISQVTGTLFLRYMAKHLKKVENTTLSCGVPELDIKNGQ